ncbi:MAG: HAMP domain-containing protein [Candidatus Riflebacteria bacterium]|nr:HAMP domain-containing protein [Candidatus Riflebacteria bacterium]
MNLTRNLTAEPGESLLTRLFLLLALVALPLFVAWWSFRIMIIEQTATKLEILRERIKNQAWSLSGISKPQFQLRQLRQWLIQKHVSTWNDKRLIRLLTLFEKRYPGAFRWVFWDSKGKCRDVRFSSILPGKRMWDEMMHTLFNGEEMLDKAVVRDALENNAQAAILGIKLLQQNLGSTLKAERMYMDRGKILEGKWIEHPALITWDVDAIDFRQGAYPRHIRGGVMLIVNPEKLPPDFGVARSVLNRRHQKLAMPFPMMMIHVADPKEHIVDPALPHSPKFVGLVREAYLQRQRDELDITGWIGIAAPVDVNVDIPQRLVVLADSRPILALRDQRLSQVTRVVAFLFCLAGSGILFFRGSSGLHLSLRWRITGLFLIAILVPVTGLLGFGGWFITREESRLRDKAMERMRLGLVGLDLRYKDAPKILEKNILNILGKTTAQCKGNVDEFIRLLDKLCSEEILTYYYLSDNAGKLDRTNFSTLDPFIKRVIVETFKTQLEGSENAKIHPSVGEAAVSEEMGQLLGKSGKSSLISRPGDLRHFAYYDVHLYYLGMSVLFEGVTRYLVVQLEASLIENYFVKKQFLDNIKIQEFNRDKNNRSSDEIEPEPELSFYSSLQNSPNLPSKATQWQTLRTAFDRAIQLKTEVSGETILNHERFLYYISPIPGMYVNSFIPCYLTSLKPITQRISLLRQQLLNLTAIASLVAVILGLILAASLLGPIGRIDHAVQLVGSGDLSVSLPETGGDEIGRLSRNINEMVDHLRQRKRMQAYVSETVLEAVKSDDQGKVAEGQAIEATILFSDIRNFTRLAEAHSPKQMFEMLNSFFGGIEPIIRDHGGRIDKFIGDAVMAVFLPDDSNIDPPERAVHTSLAMADFLRDFNHQREEVELFSIAIGIGINTGEVLLGDVGSERRKDLTVIGDAVNLASRLETASKAGKHSRIVLSEATYSRVASIVTVEEMALSEVKGKSQPVRMFEIVSLIGECS